MPDVDLDAKGSIVLNNKGMSVNRSLAELLKNLKLVPLHLSAKVRGAAGPAGARIWAMGSGPFASGPVSPALVLNAPGSHGTVCPAYSMPLATFQQELASTRDSWDIEEP